MVCFPPDLSLHDWTALTIGLRSLAFVATKDGVSSIISQGCEDKPLLTILSSKGTPISFVHVVKNADEALAQPDEFSDAEAKSCTDKHQSSDEENEWTDDNSDVENEF